MPAHIFINGPLDKTSGDHALRRLMRLIRRLVIVSATAATFVAAALWIRSEFAIDVVEWYATDPHQWIDDRFTVESGRMVLFLSRTILTRGPGPTFNIHDIQYDHYSNTMAWGSPSGGSHFAGIYYWTDDMRNAMGVSPLAANDYGVVIPLWAVMFPSLLTALIFYSLRRRHQPGHCRRCGYDLRASPDRCPECGAMAASTARIRP